MDSSDLSGLSSSSEKSSPEQRPSTFLGYALIFSFLALIATILVAFEGNMLVRILIAIPFAFFGFVTYYFLWMHKTGDPLPLGLKWLKNEELIGLPESKKKPNKVLGYALVITFVVLAGAILTIAALPLILKIALAVISLTVGAIIYYIAFVHKPEDEYPKAFAWLEGLNFLTAMLFVSVS